MYKRSHVLVKCLATPFVLRSAIQNDAVLGTQLGCNRCQINTLAYHTFKRKNKSCKGVICDRWTGSTCLQRGYSLSPLLYLKNSYSDGSSHKSPSNVESNKETSNIIKAEKLTSTLDKDKSSVFKPLENEKDSKSIEEPVCFKEQGKIVYKEPVILPGETRDFKKLDLVESLGLADKEMKKIIPKEDSITKDVLLCNKNDVELNKIREEVLKALHDKANELKIPSADNVYKKIEAGDLRATEDATKQQKEKPAGILLEKAKNILRKTSATLKSDDDPKKEAGAIPEAPPVVKRPKVDYNRSSLERNFITPVRAMRDFMLKSSDLEGLRKTKRRSPYENDPPIVVHWRKDVEAKAIEVWGSRENLLKELMKRDVQEMKYQQNIFTAKRRLKDYRREQKKEAEKGEPDGLFGSSGRVVLAAIGINGVNFVFKMATWMYTGSHSMFSEAIHSLADTCNQLILAYGIHKSVQRADSDHPYGYANMRYVSSLISGVGIFCVGAGLSFYHGFVGLTDPTPLKSFFWAFFILGGSLVSEGGTLLMAVSSIRSGAKMAQMTLSEYVWRGHDPSVNVVLLEDLAAVLGVGIAASCMGLSVYYDSHVPDAIGSLLVGGLLAGVASFIIYTNAAALVGRSIPQERLDKINAELESDVMIRAIHDVKGIDMGNSLVRYKAEMDFDGAELTRSYLDKQDLNQMLEDIKKIKTVDELEQFMLKHGENIVDMMGGEIDRIELKLRKKHPEIRHCDLEIL